VQRPLALVVVGGMLLAPLLILLVLPVLILRFSQAHEVPPDPDRDAPPARPPADPSPDAGG
jgi:cobalt-zinc-cadmium resistance protein CzcA